MDNIPEGLTNDVEGFMIGEVDFKKIKDLWGLTDENEKLIKMIIKEVKNPNNYGVSSS